MKYDILFNLEIDEKEKNYKRFFPDKKFKLRQTENEIEEIDEDFSIRSVKFIGTLNEKEVKEFIEDYSGYTKIEENCLAEVIGMPSYFPAVMPAIFLYDEMPYPPVEGRSIFITPVPENEEEFNTLKSLTEKCYFDLDNNEEKEAIASQTPAERAANRKALINYIMDKLLY